MDSQTYLAKIESLDVTASLKEGLRHRAEILWTCLPPNVDQVKQYWREKVLPHGQILVYGAGTFARRLLQAFGSTDPGQFDEAISVIAFIDTEAQRRDFSTFPRPVYPVTAIDGLQFDALVVMHPFAETSMAESAIASGCPQEKIIRVFSSDHYREWERKQLQIRLENVNPNLRQANQSNRGQITS